MLGTQLYHILASNANKYKYKALGHARLGSEQALAPGRGAGTFAEGAWDKLPKTKGMLSMASPLTHSLW